MDGGNVGKGKGTNRKETTCNSFYFCTVLIIGVYIFNMIVQNRKNSDT